MIEYSTCNWKAAVRCLFWSSASLKPVAYLQSSMSV